MDSVKEAVRPAQIIFVAVPTPSREDDAFDTSIVADALRSVAAAMKGCDDYNHDIGEIATLKDPISGPAAQTFQYRE